VGMKLLGVFLAAVLLVGVGATTGTAAPRCGPRVLVLGAMPLELNPLVEAATIERTTEVDGRTFYGGRLAGRDVVLAMTGIGLVNAAETATAAFEHSRCPFTAAVFSGVAGSRMYIGDVMVPQRWTQDRGKTWFAADRRMLAAATAVRPRLTQDVPVGDAACACPGVDAATPVHLWHAPKVRVGGNGTSNDTFGGKALPCVPGGGDVQGCRPCIPGGSPKDVATFASRVPALADPAFFKAFLTPPDATTQTYAAQDEETAAVAEVARRYGVPFLGIRGVSDGLGDPLHLPGFPAQFYVYRQLAADNAAATTIAFLRRYSPT
jgi:nucleoside phosphorylase